MSDFIAGAISGIAQTTVGQPLDTLKVNIQNRKDIKQLKPHHYFRGVMFPMVASVIINSICFGTHKYIYGKTDNHMVSGAIAGLCATPFVHLSCIGKVKRQIGLIPKLRDFIYTRGFLTSCFRELTGFGSYFYIYHTLRENNHSILLSGSFGGLANWSISYPFDVIRSRQYAYNISFMNSLKQGNLYGGYIPCALRAVIVNGTGFWVYEKCLAMLKNNEKYNT